MLYVDWLSLGSVLLSFVSLCWLLSLIVFCALFVVVFPRDVVFLRVVVVSFRGETERRIGVAVDAFLVDDGLKTRDGMTRLDILADLKGRGS